MRELVIFDIDNTIVKGQSQQLLLKYLFRKRFIGLSYFFRIYIWFIFYKLGLTKNPYKVMEYAFRFLKDKKVIEIESIIDSFFNEVLKKYFFQEAIDLIKNHQSRDREILLLSNVIDVLTRKIAEFLNIKYYMCTNLEVINNKFTGKITKEIVYGENKGFLVKNFINNNHFSFNESWAYGDHITDVYVLEISSHPFAVNPDKNLAREAQKRGWPILAFNKTLF